MRRFEPAQRAAGGVSSAGAPARRADASARREVDAMSAPDARPATGAGVPAVAADWLVGAQDGQAAAVLAEIEAALERDRHLEPLARVRARYAQAIALSMLGAGTEAVGV